MRRSANSFFFRSFVRLHRSDEEKGGREGENKIDKFDLVDGNEEEEEEKEEIIKIPLDTRYLIVLEETLRCIFCFVLRSNTQFNHRHEKAFFFVDRQTNKCRTKYA